ncbi:hypothetical protein V2J09_012969 [Rumex salicifolius]
MEGTSNRNLPPGFRFHPTDEELIVHYLKNQALSKPCPASIIPEVDIYKFDPWQLPDMEKKEFGENEWYFFTPRDRKYPNGVRPNRATVSGYWKATGTDKAIYSGTRYVGIKKALVFYKGRPPKGTKTDWIMHEYRLNDPPRAHHQIRPHGSMRLDDWVLCRIYKKRQAAGARAMEEHNKEVAEFQANQQHLIKNEPGLMIGNYHNPQQQQQGQQQMLKFPRTSSLTNLLEMDYLGPITHLLNDANNPYNYSPFEFQPNTVPGTDSNPLSQSSSGLVNQQQQWHSNPGPVYRLP